MIQKLKCKLGFHKWDSVEVHTRNTMEELSIKIIFPACIMKRCSACGDVSYPTPIKSTSIHVRRL
jgi:hypothetical protein